MSEQKRVEELEKQIELAQRKIEALPSWLRSNNHFAGTDHQSSSNSDQSGDDVSVSTEEPQQAIA
jgi:hypothetical protein